MIATYGVRLLYLFPELPFDTAASENSFGVGQLLPYQILSKDGKPYIMNCETKVFSPEEITDMVLTKVKEGRRVCMPPPPVPVFEDSSSDDTSVASL